MAIDKNDGSVAFLALWNLHSNNASRKLVSVDESKCCFVATGEIAETHVIQW